MMKTALYTILFLLFPLGMSAQGGLRQQVAKKQTVTAGNGEKETPVRKPTTAAPKPKNEPDTVYCITTKKQHGWFMPLDVVTKEQGRKNGGYLMFTRKNALGHWTKFEKFDSYGNRSSAGFRPYILSDDDPQGDKNWIQRVKTGCICEIIADPQGENVVQERVYDKDMNLVYSFSHTPIGKRKYIGTYKDIYGLPAEMRRDSTFTYGTLVVITEDKWGNDSTIEYVDAKGVPKNNSNGVGIQFYIHDKNGRVIRQGSANHNGEYVIDNWGNCGTESVYDDKTGLPKTTINMDNHWKPIPLPNLREEAGWLAGTTKRLYKYDNDRRQIEERFVTIENKPDTNIYGAHCIKFKYDAFGNRTELAGYDKNGNLAPISVSGEAREIVKYDKKGRLTYAEFYDKNNKLNSTDGYLSRRKDVYGEDDLLEEEVYWAITDGVEDTCYYFKRTNNCYYERYYDGSYEIDSLDEKGRKILTVDYHADGTPLFNKDEGFHRKEVRYIDCGKQTTEIIKLFDENHALCGDNPYQSSVYDSLTHQKRIINYDALGKIKDIFVQQWDEGFHWPIDQSDANEFGTICRAGGCSAVRHYNAKVLYTQKKSFASLVGRDEFDEPDYIRSIWKDGDGLLYYYMNFRKGKTIYYDENNQEIRDFDELLDKLPKAMSIEITDSSAYSYGIKDNDIILRYGKSYQIVDSTDYVQFIGDWSIAQMLEAGNEKQILVSRVNMDTKSYDVVSLVLPKGNPSQLGFIAHPITRTQKQRTRQQEAIRAYCKECKEKGAPCLWEQNDDTSPLTKTVVIAFPEMFRAYRQYPYPKAVIDPSLILSYKVPTLSKEWLLGQDVDVFKDAFFSRNSTQVTPTLKLCYTKDWEYVEETDFSDKTIWCRFIDYKVSESTYKELETLLKKAAKSATKTDARPLYKSSQLQGKWQTEFKQDNVAGVFELTLSKNGSSDVVLNAKMEGEIEEGLFMKMPFVVTVKNAKWGLDASILSLNFSEAVTDCSISKIELDGLEGEEKEAKVNELQTLFEQNKDELIKNADFSELLGASEFIIQELSGKELKVSDGSDIRIFVKMK